jgi:MoaA/NifB/PqqE/SkfB family radical SAM enzyme
MEEIKRPNMLMGVALLHKCNFNCEHCGYIYIGDAEDHQIRPGYKLTWDQFQTAIADCRSMEDDYWNMNFTGGETTLWEDDGKEFVDVLIETAKRGIYPSYNTNGSYFDDYGKCYDFFHKYVENTDVPLGTFISIDKFHKNYDEEKGRSKSLDNVVRVLDELPEDKRKGLRTNVVTIVTKDPNSGLPEEMISHYSALGIGLGRGFPMMAIGKAKDLVDQLPPPPDFTKMRRMRENEADERPRRRGVSLVGDDYYQGPNIVGKLGHLRDLYPDA